MPKQREKIKVSAWSEWDKHRKIKTNNTCKKCGKLIHWRRNKTGFCHYCAVTNARGNLSSNWKGGRKINSSGYVEIYYPEFHPHRVFQGKTPYVKEHILVWEKANGKSLPDGYIIHHLNGIKDDNRPENLIAIRPKNHGGWTFAQCLQKRIKELEQELNRK